MAALISVDLVVRWAMLFEGLLRSRLYVFVFVGRFRAVLLGMWTATALLALRSAQGVRLTMASLLWWIRTRGAYLARLTGSMIAILPPLAISCSYSR